MKYRNGFVSNSSSSSFIIRAGNNFSTVKDVAKYIIDVCNEHWGADAGSEPYYSEEMNSLNNITNADVPVHFNTGGDETYIRKFQDKIIITTTQNISFDLIEDDALGQSDLSESFYRTFDYTDDYGEKVEHDCPSDFTYYFYKFNDFLILEHGFFGRHDYIDNCPHCNNIFARGWILENGKKICNCQIGQIIRKQKLNNINKKFHQK